MIDDTIIALTGQTSVGEAWKAVFPESLTLASKIAIKINIANAGLAAPHWSSVQAIVNGLLQMNFNGTKFPASNLTIYDANNASTLASAGFTQLHFPGIALVKDSLLSYPDGAKDLGGTVQPYAKSLNSAQFLINVFSPRGHAEYAGNVTLGFKSHYGTYPPAYHDLATVGPYLSAINCTGPVYTKTVLSVCSGIYGMNEGNGPMGNIDNFSTYSKSMDASSTITSPTTIIMSTDPVSCEMQAIKLMRLNNKKSFDISMLPDYLKASGGIAVSAWSSLYTIGVIDESKMVVLKIINGILTTPIATHSPDKSPVSSAAIVAKHIKGHKSTFIEYRLPGNCIGKSASIKIFDIKGALVNQFSQNVPGVLNNFSWNEINAQGSRVSKGAYIVRLVATTLLASGNFSIP